MSSVEKVFEDLRLEADCNARRHSLSLQDTNICSDGKLDQCDSRVRFLKGSDPADWMADHNRAWNVTNDIKIADLHRSSAYEQNKVDTKNENGASEPEVEYENTSSHIETLHKERYPDNAYVRYTKNNEISRSRGSSLTNEPNQSQENVDENEESDTMSEIRNENSASGSEVQFEDTSSQIEAFYYKRCSDDAYIYHTKDNEISRSRGSSLTNEPNQSQENVDENEESDTMSEIRNENSASGSEVQFEDTSSHIEALHKERCPDDAYVPHTKNNEISYGKGGTQRQEADCAGITDISIEMCRYLTHQDLKRRIIDFNKRENIFANKNSWDDALRLREMRNKLILQKYKNLYENDDLEIDEETRAVATKVINTIETLNEVRTKLCNSNMYSDDARELWNQWVREDNEISETESNLMRDLRLEELEEEWNDLPLCDKNRISQLYDRIMNKSNVQNEQKLEEKIEDVNNRQKQYMNYLAT